MSPPRDYTGSGIAPDEIPAVLRPGATAEFTPQGTEARLCALIAQRQQLGLRKYGVSVDRNPLNLRAWLWHLLEEQLDASVYLLRAIEQLDRDAAAARRDEGTRA